MGDESVVRVHAPAQQTIKRGHHTDRLKGLEEGVIGGIPFQSCMSEADRITSSRSMADLLDNHSGGGEHRELRAVACVRSLLSCSKRDRVLTACLWRYLLRSGMASPALEQHAAAETHATHNGLNDAPLIPFPFEATATRISAIKENCSQQLPSATVRLGP